jgi:chemotaxis protein methyltransferase CheR
MDGIMGSYDLIFFRNALIYFPPENRLKILDSLANALNEGGILILGVSETSSVEHPLLENKHIPDAFYFQKKKAVPAASEDERQESVPVAAVKNRARQVSKPAAAEKQETAVAPPKRAVPRARAAAADMKAIVALLEHEEGRPNAQKVLDMLQEAAETAERPAESELIAAAVAFLGAGNFDTADTAVSFLEKKSNSAAASFLRGEYHYLKNDAANAEEKYQEASLKDRAFWPAFYRISSLAAEGNRTRYEYKIKKALESMKAGQDLYYESFIGGFSPDYYRHILERKLSEQAGGKI